MTCGIYKLTFPSGKFYIGKSVDIEKRWRQHWDSFQKGKHTKLMQAEYDLYGNYTQEVYLECHEDHIDIMEETYIARLSPPLNGTKGRDRLDIIEEGEEVIYPYLHASTILHISMIIDSKNTISILEGELSEKYKEIEGLNEHVEILERKRNEEELTVDKDNRLRNTQAAFVSAKADLAKVSKECDELSKECMELWSYKQLPWYKKLFH